MRNKQISSNRAWLYVLLAGALEIVWASGFKYDSVPSFAIIISLIVSFDLIIRATTKLPVGTVYAVFAGIGTVGTVIVEAVVSNGISFDRIGIIMFLLFCIVGLKLTSKGSES